jgi:hypothetical protein
VFQIKQKQFDIKKYIFKRYSKIRHLLAHRLVRRSFKIFDVRYRPEFNQFKYVKTGFIDNR